MCKIRSQTFLSVYRLDIASLNKFRRFRMLVSNRLDRRNASCGCMTLKVKGKRKTEINKAKIIYSARECSKNLRRIQVPVSIFCLRESNCIHFLRDLEA